ncbi:sugar (and other) transporter family protein [Bordetella holmesii 30539]|uniref:Sugar (And other) transporter family protein n=1 Tax=Bordetella holmesii 1058 TaxID=1247648 RepID=A0ABN0RWI5_9BORD|nr:sugar (and other) transporter family protein [Bordetella holmesii 44057]EWM40375.1 sugar (and other) transporter family protein [Bordetella holmesii 35009]EXF87631.1 sugar (and other) transporter family protein [Bordetella holmesii 30539]EXX93632.1 sugar (and other) transporter family protein [Bordetella holmesii 1058]KAK85458.1 transporter, major facilitator family protein [Bordetella holmesii CDC-H572-BH]
MRRRDWQIILLIGVAHSSSHFFQLVLPSLYVSLGNEFGLDFARLGLLVSVFYVVSGLGQASSGFVVDRVGARPVLWFGLSCFVLAAVLIGAANGYAMLMLAAAIGGVGNSIFHPADYSIINHRVSPARLGHAFSIHGLTGNLGWALTPVFITTITLLSNWRVAAFSAAGLIALVLLLTVLGRDLLGAPEPAREAGPASSAQASVWQTLTALAARPALWGAFLFFAFTSIALSSVQNYTIPLLGQLYDLSRVTASSALSGYMLASALGMAAGGFLVSAPPRTERTVTAALLMAGLTLVVLAMGWVPASMAALVVGLAGFCAGVAAPSRDMLIRRVTPKGATGSVYGLVYSGMDVGSALGPLGFGLLLDAGLAQGPWIGAGLAFAIGAILAQWIAIQARKAG